MTRSCSRIITLLLTLSLVAPPCAPSPSREFTLLFKSTTSVKSGTAQKNASAFREFEPRTTKISTRGFGGEPPRAGRPPADRLRVDLMHMDHERSPLRANLTSLADRIRRDVARSERRATVFASESFRSPLSPTLSEYVMRLALGSPPRQLLAVVDTGSDLVWVQCQPCARCFPQHPNALFDPARSSSYRHLACSDGPCAGLSLNLDSCNPGCQYAYAYGDSSTSEGDFATETITLEAAGGGPRQIPGFAFGCGRNNQGTFSSADGLVGLGQGPISFASQLGALYGDRFSYCFVSREEALTQTSSLLFGDAALPSGAQFTPILPSRPGVGAFYYVRLEGLSVGGARLSIPGGVFERDSAGVGGTVFDSGTTFTQLVSEAFDVLVRAFQLAVPYRQVSGSPKVGLDLCFDIAGVRDVVVPVLSFHFAGANFDLPAENYFVLVDNAETMCLAVSRSKSSLNIFGNTQQQNFQILYDRAKGRIGFAPLLCSSLSTS